MESVLQDTAGTASERLDVQASLVLAALIEQGRVLYREATAHTRKMLQDQRDVPSSTQ